jgi:hydroxypyruvate reductase 1
MRGGKYHGWLPTLFLGKLFHGGTVGVIGAGRIGAAYARMMVEGLKMDLVYYDLYQNRRLEDYLDAYARFQSEQGERPVKWERLSSVEDVLARSDVVSLHPILDASTHHLMNAERLALMKPDAILVNASRGPVVDEAALVAHCQAHPDFRVALDVFEDEPAMKPGLAGLPNAVIVPHIASATTWTREGMATLAASNVAAVLNGYPAWQKEDILPFLGGDPPKAAPSIVNAEDLGYPVMA